MLRRSIWLMAMADMAAFVVPTHAQQGITAPVTTFNIGQLPKTSTITNDDLFIKRDATAASGYRTQAVKASDFASYLNAQLGIVSGLTAEIIRAQAAEAANAAAVVAERNRAQGVEGVNAGAISAEVTRATAAEGVNATAVTSERTRALAAEALAFPAASAGTAATKNVGTTLGTVADGSVDPIARGAVQAAGGDASGTTALVAQVARTLAARFADAPTVKDFSGIDCTGATDSTAGFLYAGAHVQGALRIPGGCTVAINNDALPPSLTIIGDGPTSTIKHINAATGHMLTQSNVGATFTAFINLKIDGNFQNNGGDDNQSYSSFRMYAAGTAAISPATVILSNVDFVNGGYGDTDTYFGSNQYYVNWYESNTRRYGGADGYATGNFGSGTNAVFNNVIIDPQRLPTSSTAVGRAGLIFFLGSPTSTAFDGVTATNVQCYNTGISASATLGCIDSYQGGDHYIVTTSFSKNAVGRGFTWKADTTRLIASDLIISNLAGNPNNLNGNVVSIPVGMNRGTHGVNTVGADYVISNIVCSNSATGCVSLNGSNNDTGVPTALASRAIITNVMADGCGTGKAAIQLTDFNSAVIRGGHVVNCDTPLAIASSGALPTGPFVVGDNVLRSTGRPSFDAATKAVLWYYGNVSQTPFTQSDLTVTPTLNTATGNGVLQAWTDQLYVDTSGASGAPIGSFGSITGGSGYVNGTYNGVPLTGGSGTGATANLTVSGGSVTSIVLVRRGVGYKSGDVFSADPATVGGSGSGFSIPLSSLFTQVIDAINGVPPGGEVVVIPSSTTLGLSFASGAALAPHATNAITCAGSCFVRFKNIGGTLTEVGRFPETQLGSSGSTISGTNSSSLGNGNTVSGNTGVAIGASNTESGFAGLVMGQRCDDRGRFNSQCFASGRFANNGDAQSGGFILRGSAASTSAIRLTADGATAGSANVVNLPSAAVGSYTFKITLDATDITNPANGYSWSMPLAKLYKTATAQSTTTLALSTPVTLATNSWTPTVSATADTTNGGLNLSFTPPAGNTDTIHVVARVESVEVQ